MTRAAKTSRRQAVKPSALAISDVREYALSADGGRIGRRFVAGGLVVKVEPASANADAAAAELANRLRAACAIPPASERAAPWGDGQFDHVELGPGVRAALRVTTDGRVKLTIPGGELDVTDGSTTLGLGLLEGNRRAAELRVELLERARRRKAKPLCKRCGQSLFGYADHQGKPSYPLCPKRESRMQLCEPAKASARSPRGSGRLDHLPRRLPR